MLIFFKCIYLFYTPGPADERRKNASNPNDERNMSRDAAGAQAQ